ncbi:MAG: mycothiol synthase [Acidimicrobiia bacterium]|nr:mycothiol synthase [Acidimicrobiia bacterium]
MNDQPDVQTDPVAPSDVAALRRLCIEHDGTDPFQHSPPFHTGAPAPDVRLFGMRGRVGLDGFGAVWGEQPRGVVCVAPDRRLLGLGGRLGEAVVREARARGASELGAWVTGVGTASDLFCDLWQGVVDRRLFKLWIDLPAPGDVTLTSGYELRTFADREDVEALVRLNAAAFAAHPDQGSMTVADVRARMREPWFDPTGLLMAWRGDELVAFCWTKVHADVEPAEGEIHLICTSPGHQGHGLGRAMTLAGLGHLAESTGRGILYVDESNTGARAMYRGIGFRVQRVDGHYRFRLGGGGAA